MQSRYLLAIDVGNSRIKCGLFDRSEYDPAAGRIPPCLKATAVGSDKALPWDDLVGDIGLQARSSISGIIAGANPAGVARVLESWSPLLGATPTVIRASRLPLQINVAAPEKVGIDRLLNAVAANVIRQGQPAIIVDTGTATTVDYVSEKGAFEGGAILPGFELSARSLHQYTAMLPLVRITELAEMPQPVLGKDTGEALRSGLLWGQVGAVKELISRLATARQDGPSEAAPPSPMVLLTGGGSSLLRPHLPEALWEPHLALQGLAIAADEHSSAGDASRG